MHGPLYAMDIPWIYLRFGKILRSLYWRGEIFSICCRIKLKSDCIHRFLIDLEQQTDVHLEPNNSEKSKYNTIPVWFSKIRKILPLATHPSVEVFKATTNARHAEKSFVNLVNPNLIWNIITLHRLILHQIKFNIYRRTLIKIQIWFGLTRFTKDFSVWKIF